MLRLRTLLNSPGGWLAANPVSSTADTGNEPTKLFGRFNMAECEGRNWGAVVTEFAESARRADRLYRSGATRAGCAEAGDGCEGVALLEGRVVPEALLVPGTGSEESSRVPKAVCRLAFAVLGRLVIDTLAEYRERATAGCR